MTSQLRPAAVILAVMTILTGVIYPLTMTAVAQATFPHQANGSLIERDGDTVGSALIGQPFDDPAYFWGRPSATTPYPYNGAASTGSNLGPTSRVLLNQVQARLEALHAADPTNTQPVPVDLVTASGSGLDPHISPAAAYYQVDRVAAARGLSREAVRTLVEAQIEGRTFGLVGEPRVNVLQLNLALDEKREAAQ